MGAFFPGSAGPVEVSHRLRFPSSRNNQLVRGQLLRRELYVASNVPVPLAIVRRHFLGGLQVRLELDDLGVAEEVTANKAMKREPRATDPKSSIHIFLLCVGELKLKYVNPLLINMFHNHTPANDFTLPGAGLCMITGE